MKFRVSIYLTVILMSWCGHALGQGFVENALLFSRTKPGGSARIQAMGGAQIALGGDFSSALSNPAGLGMYNRSEFTFTPAMNFYESESEHLGTSMKDSKNVFVVPGLSYIHNSSQDKKGFLGGSFGISMTRTNDFQNTFQYGGVDTLSSLVDFLIEDATGYAIDPLPNPYANTPLLNFDFPSGLGYLTYLINPFSEDPGNPTPVLPDDYINYYSELDALPGETRTLSRYEKVNSKGGQYQWSVAYGGNIKDKFFFGASVGISTLRYKLNRTYGESDFDFSDSPGYNPLDYFELEEEFDIDGTGVNLTLGVIYRPIDIVQLGVSFVTPTYYEITDTYTATVRARWNDGRALQEESSFEPIISEYSLTTPLKVSTGAAFFIGENGLITGDVEFVNYSKAKYQSDISEISFDPENDVIKNVFKNVVNYRIGGELRYEIWRFRGGYNIQSSPYDDEFDIDQSIKTVSAGVGIRLKKFFIDFTWLNTSGKSVYSPYIFQDGTGPIVNLNNSMNSGLMTLGFTF